jgi:TolB protein
VRVGDGYRHSIAIANLVNGRVRDVPSTGGGDQPAWSPDGRRIAFVISSLAGDALMLVRPDGSGRRKVGHDGCSPEWSPDGTRLVVHQCSGGAVGVVRLESGELRWLTKDGRFEGTWDPRGARLVGWQDGQLVALDPSTIGRRRVLKAGTKTFPLEPERSAIVRTSGRVLFSAVDHPHGPTGLYTVGPDGSGLREFGAVFRGEPAWAPDGRLLAVVLGGRIAIMDARGKVQRVLTSGDSPAWSPDGTEIAFIRYVGAGQALAAHLFVIASRGGAARELGEGADPSWAPGGDRIVVGRDDGELWVYPAEGAEPTQVTHVRDRSVECPSESASDPAWSPDGRKIVFVQTSANCFNRGVARLAVLDVATGATRRFVNGWESDIELAPTWSPDGRFLAYEDHVGNDFATIARVRADGTAHRTLYGGPGEAFTPAWAPSSPKAS